MEIEALAIGTGPKWQREADAAYKPGMTVFAVNRAVSRSTIPVDHAVSIHPQHIAEQVELSQWNPKVHTLPNDKFRPPWTDFNSGFVAISLALDMGFDVVHVAGMPLSHYSYARTVLWGLLDRIRPELLGHVKAPAYYWWVQYLGSS